MKTKIALAAFAACALIGCNEKSADLPHKEYAAEGEDVTLTVNIPMARSKAVGIASGEDAVNNVQIFVFDSASGYMEAYSSDDSGSDIELTCKTGNKKVVALVNAPAVSDVYKLSQLSKVSLIDNTPDNLVMYGLQTCTLSTSQTITIDVTRTVAKVVLKKVEVDFEANQLNGKDLILKGAYLINVPAYYTLPHVEGSFSVTEWYNKMSNTGSSFQYIADEIADTPVNKTKSYVTEHFFYTSPNGQTTDSSVTTWSPRYTRLVVEAEYDGVTYYYPVNLPQTKANTIYDVQMKITRLGSTSPDVRVSKLDETFKVNVLDWATGASFNEII